jgi:hypothetical protein
MVDAHLGVISNTHRLDAARGRRHEADAVREDAADLDYMVALALAFRLPPTAGALRFASARSPEGAAGIRWPSRRTRSSFEVV